MIQSSLCWCFADSMQTQQILTISTRSLFQVYCLSWATAFCYGLHIIKGRPWSQQNFSSSIYPSVTLGWRSLYSLWPYHQLSLTGILYNPFIFDPISLNLPRAQIYFSLKTICFSPCLCIQMAVRRAHLSDICSVWSTVWSVQFDQPHSPVLSLLP